MSFHIAVEGGKSVRLLTAGKYCPQDIVVAATGGGATDEGVNSQAFADFILGNTTEIYNDKAVGTLAAYAFYESGATRIELPNIQYLKERCFYGCENLETLLLPGLLGYTYQYMAYGCTGLKTIDIHNTNYLSSYALYNCSSLTKLDLHRVGTIATNSMAGCSKLATLILRMDTVPTLGGTTAFTNTPIAKGTGYIYVPRNMLENYKTDATWSTYTARFRAIEDYPDICGE